MLKLLIYLVIFLFAAIPSVYSEEKPDLDDEQTFIIYWENDIFANTDRYYTNGAKLIWISGDLGEFIEDKRLPAWSAGAIESVPLPKKAVKNIALSLGQKIFTPKDIEKEELIEDDRPYAGYTYFGIGFHSKTRKRLDSLELDIGIVGPESYARDIQETVHEWINTDEPKGWNNQLKNEPALVVAYEIKYRLWETDSGDWAEFDVIPHIGAALGNVYTYANAGAEIRWGYNLPLDFGTGLFRPAGDSSLAAADAKSPPFGFHVFVGVDGRAVLQNIFLDGNTFTDSHEVDKKPFVADIMAGASLNIKNFRLTYTHVYCTKEFDDQDEAQIFGSISLSYIF